jgi:hypothetical protein
VLLNDEHEVSGRRGVASGGLGRLREITLLLVTEELYEIRSWAFGHLFIVDSRRLRSQLEPDASILRAVALRSAPATHHIAIRRGEGKASIRSSFVTSGHPVSMAVA